PTEFTPLELAQPVIELTGSRSEIVYEALPVDDPQVRRPNITLAQEILGWKPEVELREGLRRTIEEAGAEQLVGAQSGGLPRRGRGDPHLVDDQADHQRPRQHRRRLGADPALAARPLAGRRAGARPG